MANAVSAVGGDIYPFHHVSKEGAYDTKTMRESTASKLLCNKLVRRLYMQDREECEILASIDLGYIGALQLWRKEGQADTWRLFTGTRLFDLATEDAAILVTLVVERW